LLNVFKILLNFVQASHGILLPQLAVTELLLDLDVLMLQSGENLALFVFGLLVWVWVWVA